MSSICRPWTTARRVRSEAEEWEEADGVISVEDHPEEADRHSEDEEVR